MKLHDDRMNNVLNKYFTKKILNEQENYKNCSSMSVALVKSSRVNIETKVSL